MRIKGFLAAVVLCIAALPAHGDESSEIVSYLNEVMPNTTWTDATPLPEFPGYYHLNFVGGDPDTQYYFDSQRKVLVIGMMVNLDVSSEQAREQSIAPGKGQ